MTSRAHNLPATLLSALPDGRLSHSVFKTMSETDAQLERFAWLGDELALAIWRRDTPCAETSYDHPGHHTLSYYLDGGHRTERTELPGLYGAPKRLCTLPDWHESSWTVRGQMHFMHIYFLPEHFTRRAVVELDREPRELTLADRTYFEHERIGHLCAALAEMPWDGADAQLRANEVTHETLSHLLLAQSVPQHQARVRGGLSPAVRRRLADYIEANLAQNITLGMLAQLACLSEYHLLRMFKVSFGMPPSAWIAARRIDHARMLLKTTDHSLQQIADACGYADLSHFSHRFRTALGAPPSRYRSIVLA
ncbi:helix-turn-helix domain-containing protein [Pseudoduganella sp. FT55W]|uniref:Helix-turn-helix domain-containing protein n=1 Tax=Duganella rivi TaxID=2666083 RepID=A0A7X4GW57_9BURK|nr:AraC family transcriptional regulator [Duganella rivi]MYM69827.1 helix-turn-helix domain-containing protein [Duganella rivi]